MNTQRLAHALVYVRSCFGARAPRQGKGSLPPAVRNLTLKLLFLPMSFTTAYLLSPVNIHRPKGANLFPGGFWKPPVLDSFSPRAQKNLSTAALSTKRKRPDREKVRSLRPSGISLSKVSGLPHPPTAFPIPYIPPSSATPPCRQTAS